MQEVVIVGAARTPIGLYRGSLADQRSQDMAACSMKEAVVRSGIDSSNLDASIFSEAIQTGLPANVGRHAWLLTRLSQDPTGYTMNALCAGAIQTMFSGFNKIIAGEYQAILAGGVETNSQAPYYIQHARYYFGPGNLCFHDQKVEIQTNAQPAEIYGELTVADLADSIAVRYGFSRQLIDEYVMESKSKAAAAAQNAAMIEAIVPVIKTVKKKEITIDSDEGVKQTTSMDKLMAMPSINSCGTASQGNIAPLADGAASVVMLSADKAQEWGCKRLGTVLGFGIAAGNPTLIERTSARSIEKALNYAGLGLKDVDFIDIHEQSSAYTLAVANLLGSDAAGKINVDGGSLAYGHAGAATGGAMVTNMLYRLQRTGRKVGLINVGAFGGQSLSVIIKNS